MNTSEGTQSEAIKELTRQWIEIQPILFAYIRTSVSNYADAEDLLQVVAQDIVAKYEGYDSSRPFIGWVLWLAKSRIIDHYRKQGRDKLVFGEEALSCLATASEKLPAEASWRQEALDECIQKLPAKSVQLLEMRYVDDMKPQEMSEALGTTSGTVRVALTRLRKAIAQCVEAWKHREGRHV